MAMMMIPGVGTALGLGMIAKGISVAAVIGLGMMIAGNVLMGPSVPKVPGSLTNGARDRLFASLDVSAPRKILFGDTAGATDVRYQTYTGTNQEFMEQIIAVASHKVNAIYELWLDNEKAWDSTGGVVAKFSGFLTVNVRNEATSANGIAIDSVWTTTATLTGCAYIHIKAKLTGTTAEENNSPFASGLTNRVTLRTRGASVYDPRLDSTVTGGSGTQRADDQATWAWDANGSRNPALQLLFYLLGWKINSKLAVGMGLPKARIDLASFITAANACDESVTLSDGVTTEPRYRSDGVLSESDDRTAVVEALCATMNAVMRDAGGKLSLYVLHNDLAAPVASFDENDVLGAMKWTQTPSIPANITRGQRTDPSDNALYQPVDYPEVKLTSTDGIDRIDTVNYPLVQSNGQAQRLAKQRLQRAQYQGRLNLTGKPSWWQVSIGDVIQLTHSTFGWTNKLFRVAGQRISRSGETEVMLVEENAAIYQWDNNEAAAVQAGAPTIYDPQNSPLVQGINKTLDEVPDGSSYVRLQPVERTKLTDIEEQATKSRVFRQTTAPASPTVNDVWVDTSVTPNVAKTWSGSAWVDAANLVTSADHVPESATKKWAGETGADVTSGKSLDVLADGSTYARIKASELSSGQHKLMVAGSGARLPDGRAQASNRNFGLRSTYTGGALTGVDDGTTARIDIASSSWNTDWGTTITFPSASITGLPFSTKYYVWRIQSDPTTAGSGYGHSTAESDALGTGKTYLGHCTTPADGGGSTGGTSPGMDDCVHPDAWVEMADGSLKRARHVVAGDRVLVLNHARDGTRTEEVESNHLGLNERVRLITERGIAVTLSANTPLTLKDGTLDVAANAVGHELPVKDGDSFRWERCVQVKPAGFGEVAHIRCHQATYAAGDIAGRSILTHNPKQ